MNAGSRRIRSFLRLAEEELLAAQLLARQAPRQASYFCQQCAEKIARAILTDAGVPFGTGHNLGQMANALPQGHPWIETIRSLDRHSPAATRYRYSAPAGRLFDPPAPQQIEEDITELQDLLDEVRASLTEHLG